MKKKVDNPVIRISYPRINGRALDMRLRINGRALDMRLRINGRGIAVQV